VVSSENQKTLALWLCERIGLAPTENIQCIGDVSGGRIRGVVGFDDYNGASIMMHAAGEPGWLTRDLLNKAFDYPFNVCKVNMVIGLVPSGNTDAIRFNTHLGFKTRTILEGAHPDGALLLMTMERGECRYLNRKRYGQKVKAAAST
jgi:L-amino acid N-acyltransferase YncA